MQTEASTTLPSLERINEYFALPSEASGGHALKSGLMRNVTFADVSFSYAGTSEPKDHFAVEGISFSVRPGEHVAIIGDSGSGKSTLALLLCRFLTPLSGSIFLDDYNIADLDVKALRSSVCLVTHDALLLCEPVSSNIRYGREEASPQEVVEVAKRAMIHDRVAAMPYGYETPVGVRGHALSAGERQRIAIARALIRRPDVLILDEATNALDAQNEATVVDSVVDIMSSGSILTIAHRFSTIRRADRIVAMHAGRIVEEGTPDQLLQLGGYYADLYAQNKLKARDVPPIA